MASGYHKNQARKAALSLLGKALTRRANRSCELCETSAVKLRAFEVAPIPAEPTLEHTILTCEQCLEQLESSRLEPSHARVFTQSMWSDVPAVQVCAVRLLHRLADSGEAWATEALDTVYLAPDVEAWIEDA